MRKFFALITVLAMAGALAAQSKPAQKQDAGAPPPITGKWTMTLDMSMGPATPSLEITKQDGEKVVGSYTGRYGIFGFEGKVKNRTIEFSFTMTAEDQSVPMSFSGEIAADGQTMKGTAVLGELGDATWTAKKEKK